MCQQYCAICGHPIFSQTSIERGYGSECASAYLKAKRRIFLSIDENSLRYNWLIKVDMLKPIFIKLFSTTKFRSEFRKSFYTSMCVSERCSKKQFDIMWEWIIDKDYDLIKDFDEKLKEQKRLFFEENSKDIKVSPALIEIARKELRGSK